MENKLENLPDVSKIMTPLNKAIEEQTERIKDKELITLMNQFFEGDIPPYMDSKEPLLYLARHVATPNFETLNAIKFATENNIKLVIGEDLDDKFAANNFLKKSLAKLTVETGIAKNNDPIIENFTVVDFNKYSGLPFNKVLTKDGSKLIDLHKFLMSKYTNENVMISNESTWVGKYHKGNLLEYYKRFLSLTVVHCIMLEFYAVEDSEFVEEILRPAAIYVESTFGHKPFITNLIEPEQEFEQNWLAYPKEVKDYLGKFIE